MRFGEEPSRYERAVWHLASTPFVRETKTLGEAGDFAIRFPEGVRRAWLEVESAGHRIEASFPPVAQALPELKPGIWSGQRSKVLVAGVPAANARVWLQSLESSLEAPWRPADRLAITAADGSFELDLVAGERVALHVHFPGYPVETWQIVGQLPPQLNLSTLGAVLRGRALVYSRNQLPASGVLVWEDKGPPLGFTDQGGGLEFAVKRGSTLCFETSDRKSWQVPARAGEVRTFVGGEVLLVGRILDAEQKGISRALVTTTSILDPTKSSETATQKDGTFALGPVQRSALRLDIRSEGHSSHQLLLEGQELQAAADRVDVGEIVLAKEVTMQVWVFAKGQPVAGANVYPLRGDAAQKAVLRASPPFGPAAGRTADDGAFLVRGLASGELVAIEVRAKGYAPFLSDALTLAEGERLEVELEESSRLKVEVLYEPGRPAAWSPVDLKSEAAPGGELFAAEMTDDAGLVEFRDLPRGKYRLRAEADGWGFEERQIDVQEPEEFVTIQVEPGATLRLQVRGPNGEVLPSFQVQRQTPMGSHLTGGTAGTLEIFGLNEGIVEFEISASGYQTRQISATIPRGGEARLEVTLQPATGGLRGRALDPEGEPLAGASLVLVRKLDQVQISTPWAATTDGQGYFAIEEVAQGRFLLVVKPQGRADLQVLQQEVTIGTEVAFVEIVVPIQPAAGKD